LLVLIYGYNIEKLFPAKSAMEIKAKKYTGLFPRQQETYIQQFDRQ